MVDAVLRVQGLKGLVLETFGAGNAPGGADGVGDFEALNPSLAIPAASKCIFRLNACLQFQN